MRKRNIYSGTALFDALGPILGRKPPSLDPFATATPADPKIASVAHHDDDGEVINFHRFPINDAWGQISRKGYFKVSEPDGVAIRLLCETFEPTDGGGYRHRQRVDKQPYFYDAMIPCLKFDPTGVAMGLKGQLDIVGQYEENYQGNPHHTRSISNLKVFVEQQHQLRLYDRDGDLMYTNVWGRVDFQRCIVHSLAPDGVAKVLSKCLGIRLPEHPWAECFTPEWAVEAAKNKPRNSINDVL